jgi:hypothetical protein
MTLRRNLNFGEVSFPDCLQRVLLKNKGCKMTVFYVLTFTYTTTETTTATVAAAAATTTTTITTTT